MKLANNSLFKHWTSGKIIGFISKSEVGRILHYQPNGTFLIRFSESTLGAITVNLKHNDRIYMIEPWTAKALNVRSLELRVRDLHKGNQLGMNWLYLNSNRQLVPVTDAFPIPYNSEFFYI